MKKLFRRFIAYTIDMMVIILIAQSLSGIPQINKQLNNYNKYYNGYMELYELYASFKVDLTNDFKDKNLTEKEYNSLIENHEKYVDTLNEYYMDGKLTEKNYDKLNKKIDKEYNREYKKVYYKIEQNSVLYFVIYLVIVFTYFVGFNKYTNGQTLGKKLTKLRIINSKDENENVPVWSYVVRALILYQPIYYIIKLVGVSLMDMNMYYTITSFFYDIQYYLEMLIVIMVMVRIDGRGPHDLLARTRVVLYDRSGKEVQDKVDVMISKKMETIKKTKNKKIIDEEPSEYVLYLVLVFII